MRPAFLTAVFLLTLGLAAPAQAVTLSDLVGLSKSGLSDDILIALVDAEQSVFHLTAADLQQLKREGLSDRLLVHLLQTPAADRARTPTAAPAAAASPSAPVIVIDRVESVPVPVYLPIYVPVVTPGDRHPPRQARPVYWGWGGKRRPDAWQDAPRREHPRDR